MTQKSHKNSDHSHRHHRDENSKMIRDEKGNKNESIGNDGKMIGKEQNDSVKYKASEWFVK